jgi:hypothetical protein
VLLLFALVEAQPSSEVQREHGTLATRPDTETVGIYNFTHRIRHPCGHTRLTKHSIDQPEEDMEPREETDTKTWSEKMNNLLLTLFQDTLLMTLQEDMMNIGNATTLQLVNLEKFQTGITKRNAPEEGSVQEVACSMFSIIAYLQAEVAEAFPMPVSGVFCTLLNIISSSS